MSPGVSSRLVNVNPCLSTKDWYDDWLPAHATPTTETESANFLCASSTEGASALQVPQPGAQNHNTTGFCASAFDNTNVSPLTVFATKLSTFEPGRDSVLCEDASVVVTTALMEEESVPQAESTKTAPTSAAVLLNFIFSA
jgi:hypothetical protein